MYGCGGAPPADGGTTADPPVPPRPSGAATPPLARYTTYSFVHHIIYISLSTVPPPSMLHPPRKARVSHIKLGCHMIGGIVNVD